MYVDPDGHMPFFILTMLIGAALYGTYRGIKAYNNGVRGGQLVGEIGLEIVIGGAIGAAVGLATGILFAAKATASISAVWAGAKVIGTAYMIGGPGAASYYIYNNMYKWWNGYDLSGFYPLNSCFSSQKSMVLDQGSLIQRFGDTPGSYVSNIGSYYDSSLPYNRIGQIPNFYILNEPINVIGGPADPWFGQPSGGMQYLLPQTIQELLEAGIISVFGG